MQDISEREKKEIETQILAEIDTTEIVFMEQALDMLKKKKESTIKFEEPKLESADDETPIVYEKHEANGNKLDWFDVTEDGAAIDVVNQIEELKIDSNLNPNAAEFNVNLDNQLEEFPITECLTVKNEPEESDLTDIDKQNQAKYFYFYQGKILHQHLLLQHDCSCMLMMMNVQMNIHFLGTEWPWNYIINNEWSLEWTCLQINRLISPKLL